MPHLRQSGSMVEVIDDNDSVIGRLAGIPTADVVTPYAFGAKGNGSADDTGAVLEAIDACPVGGLLDLTGLFKVSSSIVIPKAIRVRGIGAADNLQSRIIGTSGISSGAVLSFAPGVLTKGMGIQGVYIDASSCPNVHALEVDNADSFRLVDVKTRGGLNSLHIANSQFGRFYDFYGTNPTQFGILADSSSATSNQFIIPQIYQTSGATTDMTAGYEIKAGVDWQFMHPYMLRAPGIAFKCNYGFRANYNAGPTLAQIWIFDGDFDGISTKVSDDANCAAVSLVNAKQVHIFGKTWISAHSGTDATDNIPLRIDGCQDINLYEGLRLNGRGGIWFFNTVDDLEVDVQSQQDGGGNLFNFGAATVTNLRPRRTKFYNGSLTDNAGALATAAKAGFFGTNPIVKPTVSGAKGSNAALGSLMTALANLGLVIDSTSA